MSKKTSRCSYLTTFLWSSFTAMRCTMGITEDYYTAKPRNWCRVTAWCMQVHCVLQTSLVTPQFLLCCHIHIFASGESAIRDERYNIYREHFWFCTPFALKGWFLPSKTSFLYKATKKGSKRYHNYLHFFTIPILRLKKLTVRLSDLLEVIQEACSFLKPCTIFNFRKPVSFNRL